MDPRHQKYADALKFAERQVLATCERTPDYFPIYTVDGKWQHGGELWTDWTGGFFLPLTTLVALSERRLEIDFDLYANGSDD